MIHVMQSTTTHITALNYLHLHHHNLVGMSGWNHSYANDKKQSFQKQKHVRLLLFQG